MQNPEIGTAPRPDVTGIGKYSNADALLGINPTPANPTTRMTVVWDFNEDKFPPNTAYQVEVSFHADFERDKATAARLQTGLSADVAAATFTADIVNFTAYGTGTPVVTLVALGNTMGQQIYVRIRAEGQGVWSETLMAPLKPSA